jgi:hypothetical protein
MKRRAIGSPGWSRSHALDRWIIAAASIFLVGVAAIQADDLVEDLTTSPVAARCWTYWYWHAKATKEGISRDLEAMHEQGIEGAIVFPFGEYMKPEWIPLFRHMLDEAERLHLKIALNNDAFWSCQVPWMTPELAEKQLVYSELAFDGGRKIAESLPAPTKHAGFYRDVVVLACRATGERAASDLDAAAMDLKTARTMLPSYAAGALDVFYARPPETSRNEIIGPNSALDITDKMDPDGRLNWDAPAGRWVVLRFGFTVLRKECPDFFRREALDYHLKQSLEKLIPIAGKHAGTTWTHVHEDSYENGAQTWTPAFRDEFHRRRGYNMTPWMPVLAGRTVGSRALSERFLHDYRATISELYCDNHFKYFESRLAGLGLKFSNEGGYGWASAIADGLQIEATAELPMGEFWHAQKNPITGARLERQFVVHGLDPRDPIADRAIPYGLGLNSVRLAASAAHIHGKPYCQAEAFTSYTAGGYDLCNPPFSLKATVDRAFCDGLGRVVFHVYDLQRAADEKPNEVWLGVGVHFNRNITWWNLAKAFTDYLARCQHALRQGDFVADFAYWTGDTMPYECPDRRAMRPALPLGCNADLVNSDVLRRQVTVVDHRITLNCGMSYRYLVMHPTRDTIDPESLRAIRRLIEAGATVVLGPRPVSAAGLENYPDCDEEVRQLADAIWGAGEQAKAGRRTIGQGRAVWGRDLAEMLRADGVSQDFAVAQGDAADFEWIHRRTKTADLYFISNQIDREQAVDVAVRVAGGYPFLWDPVSSELRVLPEHRFKEDVAIVPLRFAPRQSWFLCFVADRLELPKREVSRNCPAADTVMELGGPWDVSFDPKWGGPAKIVFDKLADWSKRPEEGIQHYSGTATYRKTFDLPTRLPGANVSPIYLDLGNVKDLAVVRMNGKPLGVVWTAPWRIDVRRAVKAKDNLLEIDIVNQWPNRLIGDAKLPLEKRLTKSNYRLKADDPLVPSGLIGPVTLQIEVHDGPRRPRHL